MYIGRRIRLNFQEFYYTLLHQFKRACSAPDVPPEEILKLVTDIQVPLLNCLQEQLANGQTNFTDQNKNDLFKGIYLSAALGDELHLNQGWQGKDIWKTNMLEHQLFHTQNSGDQIPTEIDQIIRNSQNCPVELLEIYFLLLALGFKGRFSTEQVFAYQKRFLTLLFPAAPFLYDQRQTELIPGHAHNVVLGESNPSIFLDTRRWFMTFFVFMTLFVTCTTYVWYVHHHDIGRVVQQLDVKTLRV